MSDRLIRRTGRFETAYTEITTTTSYYAFEDVDGKWFIQKEVVAGDVRTYSYAEGSSDVDTNWTNRATLAYYPWRSLKLIR